MSSADPQGIQAFPEALTEPDAWLEPFEWYQEMREGSPVRYDPARGSWDVFRHADVKRVISDDETFSVDPRNASDFVEAGGEGEGLILDTMLFQDPPRHDELRAIVEEAFSPRVVAELEPRLRELMGDLLDDALATNDGTMDLVDELAYPFPVIVIAEVLGVPSEDRAQFREWSESLVAAADGEAGAEVAERQQASQREMAMYFLELIEDRRENPRDDLLSTIATAELSDGSTLPQQEALGMCMLLLIAGNITTTNLITNAVRCFGNHDLFAELAGEENAIGTAVEEVLRYRAPVQAMTRVARSDVTLGGETIEEGDRLVAWLGSANRDSRQFATADEFVVDRAPTGHLGFGHGTHYCLGAPLARLEARVALSELLSRVDGLALADTDLSPTRSSFIYGVESLPIRYDAA
ncbi:MULTISPECIES: cytochrome P450 [Halococcus]|uniref:Cytochrome P450 n=1 Tax=Halococcus salifodinae DSM 8989 TaxID=1227456 RepID=M0MWI4_9EURY|nr:MULTISPECIES: cytochrome P450 [Halococcus]EMA50082.1 cytochrome P450 [Halococcus salifodinae DSM 8989]